MTNISKLIKIPKNARHGLWHGKPNKYLDLIKITLEASIIVFTSCKIKYIEKI